MVEKMIIDADFCIKLGWSAKYRYLYDILPLVSKHIYIHIYAYKEVMIPSSAVDQLNMLINENKVVVVSESTLDEIDRNIFDATYKKLESVMINPRCPNKNKGEVCSLSYAKAMGIPIFATDEMNLQPIIDSQLNSGIDDITCLRIIDIIMRAKNSEINVSRKICKALWVVSGKSKDVFDKELWPIVAD